MICMHLRALDVTFTHTFIGDEESGAQLIISAQVSPDISQPFVPIDTVTMRAISQSYTHSYAFKEENKYYRFRFTYKHLGGVGTIRIKQCDVIYPREIETIYDGEEHMITAPTHQAQIAALEPEGEYMYRLVATEDKGCEPHITEPGYTMTVKTIKGAPDPEKNLTVYLTKQKSLIVYFPSVTKPNIELLLYDTDGRLLQTFAVPENVFETEIELPNLCLNTVYLLKYGTKDGDKDSISRKDKWAKFLYW